MSCDLKVTVRQASRDDYSSIIDLCEKVYPGMKPWNVEQFASHEKIFPEGQLVAVDESNGDILGFAASLIVLWDDYDMTMSWRDFTDAGMFTNHDPVNGRTLYGAEVIVLPDCQGKGVGSALYRAREKLAKDLNLLRIRAGARLRAYHKYADRMTPEQYVKQVVEGHITDPTLSFQLHRGFKVLAIAPRYLRHDPESLGYAAVIEWLNEDIARAEDYRHQRQSPFYR